jgi:NAD(P)-dependent dehydrogenase (short-subunit alcohol dehydrogenase family)
MPTVFISGANRGIGLELAKLYASKKFKVFAAVRDLKTSDAVSKCAEVVELDVASAQSIAAVSSKFDNETIDILINNAGTFGPSQQSAVEMDFEGFLETLNVNTLGPLRLTQALLPALRRAAHAKIITISSNMGAMSSTNSDNVAYRASKAAVNKVMQCLATQMKQENIAVAALHPGWVRTDMGGANADISVGESAEGIYAVVRNLSLANTGKFLNYNGDDMSW